MTLTSQSGKIVTLFSTPQKSIEFIHVNGIVEPFITVNIPQDVYTSATLSVGYSQFTCVSLDPSSENLDSAEFAAQSPSSVTVNLPVPIKIAGTAMALSLSLLVSKSASWSTCNPNGIVPFTITPSFELDPIVISAEATNSANGKAMDLQGLITSVDPDGSGFSVTAADGPGWQVVTSGSTLYQGVSGSSQLAAGMPVDMDATIQEDGSLLATRIAVYDTNAVNLSISSGLLLNTNEVGHTLAAFGVEAQGHLLLYNTPYYMYDNAVFQVSGPLTNLQNLPFTPSFNASNMVDGQHVTITTHALSASQANVYPSASTVTLLPQTINGTINGISSSAGFTTYMVTLPAYDLFSDLAAQPNQVSVLSDPESVVVYVDSDTQLLNTTSLAIGNVLRFRGLVFNDNGTLRMDCAQVDDGISE